MTELDGWPSTIFTPFVGIKENPNTACESGWGEREELPASFLQTFLEMKATWHEPLWRDHL